MSGSQLTRLSSRHLNKNVMKLFRNYISTQIIRANKDVTHKTEINVDQPYPYTTSEAAKWTARESRKPDENKPECQSLVISLSMIFFLSYFCIFREENDVDEIFTRDLRSYFPEMSDSEFYKAMGGGNRPVK